MSNDDAATTPPRRDFLGMAVGVSATAVAAAVGYPVARFVEPRPMPSAGPTLVGKVEDFALGAGKTVLVDEKPVLVIRAADGRFKAFSAICTHLQCVVGYSVERNQIECPCHRGVYSADGVNIAGPPPRPLTELVVAVREGAVIVSEA